MTTYEYDNQGRLARAVTASPWTAEDRALMLARRLHQRTLCSGCGHPIATAHHPDNEGWFEVTDVTVCHACTAHRSYGRDETDEARLLTVTDTRDYDKRPLPDAADLDEGR